MQEDLTSRQPRSRICNIEFRLHKPLCCYVRLQAFQSIDSDLVGPSASWLHIRMAAEPKGGEISLDVDVFRTDIGSMGFEIHDFALDELPSFQASGRGTFVIGLEEADAAARMTGNWDVEGDFGPVGKDFRWGNSEAGLVSDESRVRGVTYVWVLWFLWGLWSKRMKFGVIDSGSGLSAGAGESAATGLGRLNDWEEYNENRRIEISSIVVASTVDSSKRKIFTMDNLGQSFSGRKKHYAGCI